MKKNDMNLLERYRSEQKRKSNQSSPVKVYLAILVVTILLIGAFAIKLLFDNLSMESKIQSTREYVESSQVNEKLERVNLIQANLDRLDTIETQVNSLTNVLDYKPRFDSKYLDIIYYEKPTIVKFTKITYELNTITLSMTGTRPSDASNYVLRLQRTKSFADVSYDGYIYNKDTKLYNADIICILRGNE